jgi:hypothetical protein
MSLKGMLCVTALALCVSTNCVEAMEQPIVDFEQASAFCSKIRSILPDQTAVAETSIKRTLDAVSKSSEVPVELRVAIIEKIKIELSDDFPFIVSHAREEIKKIANIDSFEDAKGLGGILFESQLIKGYFDLDILLEAAKLLYRYNLSYLQSAVVPYMKANGLESYIPS